MSKKIKLNVILLTLFAFFIPITSKSPHLQWTQEVQAHEITSVPGEITDTWVDDEGHQIKLAANEIEYEGTIYQITSLNISDISATDILYIVNWDIETYQNQYHPTGPMNPQPLIFTYNITTDILSIGTSYHRLGIEGPLDQAQQTPQLKLKKTSETPLDASYIGTWVDSQDKTITLEGNTISYHGENYEIESYTTEKLSATKDRLVLYWTERDNTLYNQPFIFIYDSDDQSLIADGPDKYLKSP